jgi:hypothetical protein
MVFLLPEDLWFRVTPVKEEDEEEGSQVEIKSDKPDRSGAGDDGSAGSGAVPESPDVRRNVLAV